MDKKLHVGIIGTGVGLRSIAPGFSAAGRARIAAIVGRTPERAIAKRGALQNYTVANDVEELCSRSDIDLICVASPTDFHLAHAQLVIPSGKHVYLEKPIGVDAIQTTTIAELANVEARERHVVVGHQLRFNPYLRRARELISVGELGEVYAVRLEHQVGRFADVQRPWTWEFESRRAGGVRLAMGTHLVDLAIFLLGRPPETVFAHTDPVHIIRHPRGEATRTVDTSSIFAAMINFGRTNVILSTNATAYARESFNITVSGTTADLTFNLPNRLLLHRRGNPGISVVPEQTNRLWQTRTSGSVFSTSFIYFAEALISAILDNQPGAIVDAATPADAILVMQTLDAALDSARTNTAVACRPDSATRRPAF